MSGMVHKTQTIFINSANRDSGTISDFNIILSDQVIKSDMENCQIRLSVVHLSINKSYYTIEPGSYFILNNITYNITPAYYDVYTFITYILSIIPSGWNMIYNENNNTYTILTPIGDTNTYNFNFVNCGNLFGFNNGLTNNFTTQIISAKPILMNVESSLYLKTDIPRLSHGAVDNQSGIFQESNILCAIPNVYSPYNTLTIDCSNQFIYYLAVKSLASIRLYITDENNFPINLEYDWTCALKFEYIALPIPDPNTKLLEEIRDSLKILVMRKLNLKE